MTPTPRLPFAALACTLVCALTCALAAVASEITFDLTTAPTNQPPKGFRSTLAGSGPPPDWKVILVDAPTTFSPILPNSPATRKLPVIAQLSSDPTDERFPLLIYDNEVLADFTFSLRFQIAAGSAEQMAGIVFRFQDERNFYVARASALGRNFRFYRVSNGLRDTPIGPEISIAPGTWHDLSVECRGNRFRLHLDGQQPIPEITDSSFAQGKIGLWTKSDAVSYFADLRLSFTPRVPLATTLVRDTIRQYPRILDLTLFSTTSTRPELHAVAATRSADVGKPAGSYEKRCITENLPLHGKSGKKSIATLPLHDRNGDPIAAIRFELQSFPGQTDANAVARVMPIIKFMEARVTSLKDLTE